MKSSKKKNHLKLPHLWKDHSLIGTLKTANKTEEKGAKKNERIKRIKTNPPPASTEG